MRDTLAYDNFSLSPTDSFRRIFSHLIIIIINQKMSTWNPSVLEFLRATSHMRQEP